MFENKANLNHYTSNLIALAKSFQIDASEMPKKLGTD